MLFNSLEFVIFFIIVYALYLALSRHHKLQNLMLLIASCLFYGAWDWRFLALMFVSITTDFFCAKYIYHQSDEKTRKRLLVLNFIVNFGILGIFKYFNFFQENLQILLNTLGISITTNLLHIILPIGISFYTFQAMSYAFDVYRRQIIPVDNFLDYALFVTYFPQLVAGPIERASHLLPQVLKPRLMTLDKFYEGCYLILWGYFQKIFVADNLAKIVDPVFLSSQPYNGFAVLLAVYAFAFQIYCDFAGYSNIARGLSKCMGFDIMLNFNLPYFAVNAKEFWQRWHISLSTWLRDYLYIPLGGNRMGNLVTYRNLVITMVLGGLWHGAAWTFLLWGAYQGVLLISQKYLQSIFTNTKFFGSNNNNSFLFVIKVVFFFHLICFGWLIFRAYSVSQVFLMTEGILSFPWNFSQEMLGKFFQLILYVTPLLCVETLQFKRNDNDAIIHSNLAVRLSFCIVCFYLLLIYGVENGKQFIYFQF